MKWNKLLLLFALFFLMSVPFVSADLSDNTTSCYTFESDGSDSWGYHNFTNFGVSFVSAKIGKGADFEASETDSMNQTRHIDFETQKGTVCAWLKVENLGGNDRVIGYQDPTGNSFGWGIDLLANTWGGRAQYDVSGYTSTPWSYGSPVVEVYNHICYTWESGSQIQYTNGTADGTDSSTTSIVYSGSKAFELGRRETGTDYYDGIIDELMIWSDVKTAPEILDLFTNETTCAEIIAPPVVPATTSGFNVTAKNIFDASGINNFTATISNSSYSEILIANSTHPYTFFHNITNGNYTLNISNTQFFNSSVNVEIINQNLTYIGNLTQSYTFIEAFHSITGTRINAFNITSGSNTNETFNGTSVIISSNGERTIIFDSVGYYGQSLLYNATNLTTQYIRFNVTSHILNITAHFFSSGAIVTNFTTNITRIDTDFTQTESEIITNGIATFEILNGTYNISIDAPNYAIQTALVLINATDTYFLQNFSLLERNSFNITFSDTLTHDLIDSENITFEIFSDVYANNYTTANGTLLLTLLTPSAYIMRYHGDNYPEHFFYFNLSNGTFNDLELHLLSSSIAANITISITDQYNNPVEGARIHTYRFYIPENADVLQEIQFTDFEGNGIINGQLGAEYYRFFIYYQNILYKSTTRAYLESTTLSIPITIGQPTGQQYFTFIDDLGFSLTYDNYSDSFNYTYIDSTATASSGCITLYAVTNLSETMVNTTCLTGSSGSFAVSLTPINGTTYVADAYINQSTISYYMGSLKAVFDPTGQPNFGTDALWLAIIITLIFTAFAATFGAPYAVILAPWPTAIMTYLGLLNFSNSAVTGIAIIFLIFGLGVVRS